MVIHLIGYVGTPSSGSLYQAAELAIAAHVRATGNLDSAHSPESLDSHGAMS